MLRSRKKQHGAVAILVGFTLFILIGMLALVIDLGHLYLAKTGLQNGADAAALADRNISDIPGFSSPGAIRGDPKDNDTFFFICFAYNITLGKGKKGSDFGNMRRGRSKMNGRQKCLEF